MSVPAPTSTALQELLADATVLIVEDQAANVALLQRILRAAGIARVVAVTNPRLAVQACLDEGADLILLDWHMPGMSGRDVLAGLHEAVPPDDQIPVIVLTADNTAAVRDEALAMGAKDFLTKPFDVSEATLRVRNLLETRALHRQVQRRNAALHADLERHAERERRQNADHAERLERIDAVLSDSLLAMVFQPIANLQTRRLLGVEALARFQTQPERTPDVWFSEAKAVGRSIELELAAVRSAVAQLPVFPPEQFISVNVSPETAAAPALGETLATVECERVVVELTEHTPIDNYERLLPALDGLRARGVRVAVDDTGAGYSGLQHVLRLQPEIIKLDIGLTRGIDADPARRALATALVSFATEIEATIVAEGIERRQELDTLSGLGVNVGQGFYLGRPAPPPSPGLGSAAAWAP